MIQARRLARLRALVAYAAVGANGLFLLACSDPGNGTSGGAGGASVTGGTPGSGGEGGNPGLGGSVSSGGATASGGALGEGGAVSSGGASETGGATGVGGAPGTGGTARTGGATSLGGTTSTGSPGTGGARRTGGSTGGGGDGGSGGVGDGGVDGPRTGGSGSGGATATGGATGMGGATGGTADRCDVGVYDEASPPKVLSLSGSYSTHDPAVIADNGTYYLFCTGLGAWTSTNLTSWRSAGRPFGAPSWLTAAVSGVGDLWAPDISQFGGKYHLYYAGSTFGSNKSCIGHATRDSLSSGSWVDDGAATICSNVGSSDNWNAIDPNVAVDADGQLWLALGSFWSGLKIIQIDSAGKRVGTTVTSIANRPSNGGALEAPFIVRRCGYYYLFMSWDSCCKGASSTYNIRVVRSTSITGPYEDKTGTAALQGGGTLIAQGDSAFAGPGGQSVLFVDKKAYLVYHAYAKPSGAITLRIADLVWDSTGWPVPVGP
jgi:arabinan endo-1,5-alpha-L-arabinosidase